MKTLRVALVAIEIATVAALVLREGSRTLSDLFGFPRHAWDAAPDSLRLQVYDAIFVRHRWLAVTAFVAYGIAVAAAYRRARDVALRRLTNRYTSSNASA